MVPFNRTSLVALFAFGLAIATALPSTANATTPSSAVVSAVDDDSANTTRRGLQSGGCGRYAPAFCPSGRSMTGCCYKNGRSEMIKSSGHLASGHRVEAGGRYGYVREVMNAYDHATLQFKCKLNNMYCKFADSE